MYNKKILRSVVVYVMIRMINITVCILEIVKNNVLRIIVVILMIFCDKKKVVYFFVTIFCDEYYDLL